MAGKKVLLTGDRPTGRLHLGHLVGSLNNRVKLQNTYDTYLIIADLHTLTTKLKKEDIEEIPDNVKGIILDYLGAGIDPEKTTIFLQSAIPEIYELNTILQNLVTVNRLMRIPSLKDMAKSANIDEEAMPYGLLGYPVLQTADILIAKAELVPVGGDNAAHIEVAREIAKRFNYLYGNVFLEPQALISDTSTLIGTDGKSKMSKSANNAIFLSDSKEEVSIKIKKMFTDPKRIHADIPGTVENNPVFIYHDLFNPNKEEIEELKTRYRQGKVSDGEVKEKLNLALETYLSPIRERIKSFEKNKKLIAEIILNGTSKVKKIALNTLKEVKKAMGLDRTIIRFKRTLES